MTHLSSEAVTWVSQSRWAKAFWWSDGTAGMLHAMLCGSARPLGDGALYPSLLPQSRVSGHTAWTWDGHPRSSRPLQIPRGVNSIEKEEWAHGRIWRVGPCRGAQERGRFQREGFALPHCSTAL